MNMVCQKNGITIPFGEVIPFTFTFVHSLKGGPGGVNPFPYICVELIISCCFAVKLKFSNPCFDYQIVENDSWSRWALTAIYKRILATPRAWNDLLNPFSG